MNELCHSISNISLEFEDNPEMNEKRMRDYIKYEDTENIFRVIDILKMKYNLHIKDYEKKHHEKIKKVKELVDILHTHKLTLSKDTIVELFKNYYNLY